MRNKLFLIQVLLALLIGITVLATQTKKVLRSKAVFTETKPTLRFDDQGFMTLNGQRYFPMSIYTGNSEQLLENAVTVGFNSLGFKDNLNNDFKLLEKAKSLGLPAFTAPYGYALHSFSCDLRKYSHTDPNHPECSVCVGSAQTGKICPDQCNYCDPDFVTAYAQRLKNYPNIFLSEGMDEPSSHFQYIDPRAYTILSNTKKADPNSRTGSADFILCTVEKNQSSGKWDLIDTSEYISKGFCSAGARERVAWAIKYFKDPNLDMPFAESGYFADSSEPGSGFPQKDDIQQLIGVIEYFRQETGKKSIGAVLQVSSLPTQDEIRSLFYAAIGHRARGISVGMWNEITDQRNPDIYARLKNTLTELRVNHIIEHYLVGNFVSKEVTSSDPKKIDVTAFYSNTNFYLIAVNITNSSQKDMKIDIPSLPITVTAEFVGENRNRDFAAGKTSLSLDFASHQTHVLRWKLSCRKMGEFLGRDLGTTCSDAAPTHSPTATKTPAPSPTRTPTPTPTRRPTPTRTPTPSGPTHPPTPTTVPTNTPTPVSEAARNAARLRLKVQLPDIASSVTTIQASDVQIEARDGVVRIGVTNTPLLRNGAYFETSQEVVFNISQSKAYTVVVKAGPTLKRSFANVVLTQGQTFDCLVVSNTFCGELITLRDSKLLFSGDADRFNTSSGSYNKVDSADLQVLVSEFNTSGTKRSDFNLDGRVNISDLDILGRNYGKQGD
ncbi:hypothetical protein HY357_03745 [Candidatus Roizmanbacteria bacterium]|nr:hypothetical protein [Candidatus Roizmanbacteria bacterium]